MRGPAAALLLLALAGCDSSVDLQRRQICRRALPAVAEKDAKFDVLRVGSGSTPDSVRLDYRIAGTPEVANKPHWMVCSFGSGNTLASVTTDAGPVGGAALYLLKRYYLDTPEPPTAGAPETP